MSEIITFNNSDVISLDSEEDLNVPTVHDELEKGKKLYEEREFLRKLNRPIIRPIYEAEREKCLKNVPPLVSVYRCVCIPPKILKINSHCTHFGNFTIDRSILSSKEHIDYLAQPKRDKYPRVHQRLKCYYKKIYLRNCTTRIDKLAIPNYRYIDSTMKNFSNKLKLRQLNNITNFITGRDNERYTTINNAISYIQEELFQKKILKRKVKQKCKILKEKIECERSEQFKKIVWSLFEVMKDFLMTEHNIELKDEMKTLSNFMVHKIVQLTSLPLPSPKSNEFTDKFLIDLGDNLAIWVEKFITNIGFSPMLKDQLASLRCEELDEDLYTKKYTDLFNTSRTNPSSLDGIIPIDDYIPYTESSISDIDEDFGECEYEAEEIDYTQT